MSLSSYYLTEWAQSSLSPLPNFTLLYSPGTLHALPSQAPGLRYTPFSLPETPFSSSSPGCFLPLFFTQDPIQVSPPSGWPPSFPPSKLISPQYVLIYLFGCTGRKWQPTPVFLPGKFHGQRRLMGHSSWGHKESDTTEQLSTHTHWVLVAATGIFSGGVWSLSWENSWLQHVRSSSLIKDQTQAPCTGWAVLATRPPGKSPPDYALTVGIANPNSDLGKMMTSQH